MKLGNVNGTASQSGFRLGDWVVRPADGVISRSQQETVLEPRVMQLLVYLAEHAGAVVSADQLLIDVWRGAFYGDNPVHKCVALLRRALGDSAQAPRYIQTLRKRGYKLIAQVVMPDDYDSGDQSEMQRPWRGECPYVGLRAFSAAEFALYFGRTRAVAGLLGALREQLRNQRNLMLVLGPSGIGKSSLLRAGVLPKLSHVHGFDGIQVAAVTWVDLAREPLSSAELLQRLDLPAVDVAGVEATSSAPGTHQIAHALVIDHLESITHSATPSAQRLELDALLGRLAERADLLVFLLARSDAYSALLDALPNLPELKAGAGHFDMPPVGRGEIAEMIRGPARLAALSFEYDPLTRVRLDDALRDAAAEHPASLPLLQYTLQLLYDRRDATGKLNFAAYAEIGGLNGAIAGRAEALFQSLDTQTQSALPAVLAKLVRIESADDLLSGRSVDKEQFVSAREVALVDALVDARLLIANSWEGRASVRLAHDALLREWPRAHAWAQENRRLLKARHRLGVAAMHWRQAAEHADHLLPAGAPLVEAESVLQHLPDSLRDYERRFLLLSARRSRNQWRWRWAGVAALFLSAIVATISAFQARTATAVAEQRRSEGEALVDYLLDDLSVRLRTIGRLDLLGTVTAEVSRYLEQASVPQNSAHALRRARALRNLAEVDVGRGQTLAAGSAIGAALELLSAMSTVDQDSNEFDLEQGTALYWQGYLALQDGNRAFAKEAWQGYRRAAQRMLARSPQSPSAQLEMSYALNNLGNLAMQERRYESAAELIERSIEIKRALHLQSPEQTEIAAELADSISWLGSVREKQGFLAEAVEHYTSQRDLLRSIADAVPEERLWRYRLTTATTHIGMLQWARGQVIEARSALTESLIALESLVNADPSNRLWQRDLAFAALQLGWLECVQGRRDAAIVAFDKAEPLLHNLLQQPEATVDWHLLALQLRVRRLILQRLESSPTERAANIGEAVVGLRQLIDRSPTDIDVQLMMALALNVQARLAPGNDMQNADQPLLEAKQILQPLVGEGSDKRVLALWWLTLDRLGAAAEAAEAVDQLRAIGYQSPELEFLMQL